MQESTTSSSLSTVASPIEKQYPIIKIVMTQHGIQKSLRIDPLQTIWELKKSIIQKISPSEIPNIYNYAFLQPDVPGKTAAYLDEHQTLAHYKIGANAVLEFVHKSRLVKPTDGKEAGAASPYLQNDQKKVKQFLQYLTLGNIEKVKMMGKWVDPNFLVERDATPLTMTIQNSDMEMFKALISIGAFLDYRAGDQENWKTPLHIAAARNRTQMMQAMINAGIWVNAVDSLGQTAIYHAVSNGHKEATLLLIMNKAFPDTADDRGKTPLHQACFCNHEQIAQILTDVGCRINAQNVLGNTPLHVACSRNAYDCVRWLLFRGARTDIKNQTSQTPLDVAEVSNSPKIVELLKNWKFLDVVPPPPNVENEPGPAPKSQVTNLDDDDIVDIGNGIKVKIPPPPRESLAMTSPCKSPVDNEETLLQAIESIHSFIHESLQSSDPNSTMHQKFLWLERNFSNVRIRFLTGDR